ncbi:MAG TPA: DNA polymerase Y family protein [Kofleriaceae bacterium]|nr:DNA polymerase Y family protein [Kofleriaceae bacterium]
MRIACLDLPAFPLQLVWRQEPAWRAAPVVVIDEDRPQGEVLWACERARAEGVLVGQRYAHALSLCAELRARVVPGEQIEQAIGELRAALHRLSPGVEPGEPGTFWLDGAGLDRVFPELRGPRGTAWGMAIARVVSELGYRGAVVVGFSRFATYAIARATRLGVTVLRGDADERAMASEVPLARLDVAPRLREALGRLGVTRVGELVRLPAGGILERFGHDAHRLYQLAAGERWDPLVPVAPPEAPDEREVFDDDEDDVERLVFATKPPLDRLLERLAARGRAVVALHLELTLKHAVGQVSLLAECIKPAAPSLDGRMLIRLVHLRLTGAPPVAPVNAVRVWAEDVAATREQLALFAEKPRRDLRAADEALARLRAELGDDAVVRAVLRDGHLPEASFGWERLTRIVAARPSADRQIVRPLIRRVFTRPQQLPSQVRQARDDGWLLSGLEHGAVVRILGPYVVSGGWWTHELYREYHFAELRRGDCMWVYFDRNRRRWFWQGAVE